MNLQHTVQVPTPSNSKAASNYISTTKYNVLTFIPFSLILQFRRYANIYFLICAILQSIPLISPLNPASAIAPLIFVIALSMAREGYEDIKRWRSDQQNNSNKSHHFLEQHQLDVEWKNIKVGSFIKVYKQQIIPADVIPLFCSNDSGISYVQTSSLDGQKNLKPIISVTQTQLSYNSFHSLPKFDAIIAKINCEKPNANINKFQGILKFKDKTKQFETSLNQKNILLRGCKLKNTQWTIGIVVYTGKDTKLMMNGAQPISKSSNIQRRVNLTILVILAFEILCCGISAIMSLISCFIEINFENMVAGGNVNCFRISGIAFASYFILFNTFIPISLIVSLEFVKVFQGYFMSKDRQMYCAQNQRALECHTVSINQQLGQIQYILTDKTGTLTCNKMEFRNVIIGSHTYGSDIQLDPIDLSMDFADIANRKTLQARSLSYSSHHSFDSRTINYQLTKGQNQSGIDHRNDIQLMFYIITTCHQCLRQQNQYQGPSPDEVALLKAAKDIGFQFISTENKITTIKRLNIECKFQILRVIEFNSDRKRMSVVVRYKNVIKVFTKGADSSIQPLLKLPNKNLQYIKEKTSQMAKTGLRSLWFAYKSLPKQTNVSQLTVEQIESGLNLLGATAIEDKLQDFVPETIYALRQGGIKFVMLTGDKLQTADNIARSCKLIDSGYLIKGDKQVKKLVQTYRSTHDYSISPVIDGSTVHFGQMEKQLLEILQNCRSAVFCRVTPSQKAQIVRLVKKLDKLTLAIGDGANDVNMILEAHVGVGIFGQQGTRAAQVSNYAIGEFCLLWKLLLYYGRLNYMRISEMILYFFYKNMVFTIVQFAYCFYNIGSGQSFWLSWSITFYNMIFTFLPVVLRAILEVDLQIKTNKKVLGKITSNGQAQDTILYSYYPKMYVISQKNKLFTNFIFLQWFILGICQGVICLVITLYAIGGPDDRSGSNSLETGFFFCEISAYTSVIIVVTVKLALNVKRWTLPLLAAFLIPSLGAYILYCYLSNIIETSDSYSYLADLITMPTFYVVQVLCVLGMFSFDCFLFAIEATQANFSNYLKYRSLADKRLSETKLNTYFLQMEAETTSR